MAFNPLSLRQRCTPCLRSIVQHEHSKILTFRNINLRRLSSEASADPPSTSQSSSQRALKLSGVRYDSIMKSGNLVRAVVKNVPFEYCTRMQADALGHILLKRDVLISAHSCPGKTTSYLVPIFSKHLEWAVGDKGGIRILIVAPNGARALKVMQKANELLNPKSGIRVRCLHAGSSTEKERGAIVARRTDLLITTPGRLLDHLIFTEGFRDKLSDLRCIVFDNADEWKERTVQEWLPAINKFLPPRDQNLRQTLVVSNEDTPSLQKIVGSVLTEQHISISA